MKNPLNQARRTYSGSRGKLEVRQPEALAEKLAEAIAKGAQPLSLVRAPARDMINAVEPGAV